MVKAACRVSPWHGFETRHGLMPQFMANEMPDYMSDDECKMDHVWNSVVANNMLTFNYQLYFEYE